MSTVAGARGPVVAVMLDELVTLTPVAETPPIVTVAPARKLDPPMVTSVPPAVGPEESEMPVTLGAEETVQEFPPSP
jgi:hypothetical protein